MTTEPAGGQYDRTTLPLVAPDHALGPLRRMGRFEWEKVLLRSSFKRPSVKLVGLAAATYSTAATGANVRPGITRLIAVTGLGDSMVRRNLKALESAGFMFMVANGSSYGRAGKGAASDYQLTAPEPLAEQYEAERNTGTWDETDQWDMELTLDHQSPSTDDSPDHRSPSTDDQGKNTGTFDVSPVLLTGTPVLGAQNTGTPVPPMTPIPHHEIPLHQTSHQSVDRHLSDVREETTAENEFDLGLFEPLESEPLECEVIEAEIVDEPHFGDFWAAYPRKAGKTAALKAWEKATGSASAGTIVNAARRYAQDPNLPEQSFIPHPATWLNGGRWDDEPEPRRLTTSEKRMEDGIKAMSGAVTRLSQSSPWDRPGVHWNPPGELASNDSQAPWPEPKGIAQ